MSREAIYDVVDIQFPPCGLVATISLNAKVEAEDIGLGNVFELWQLGLIIEGRPSRSRQYLGNGDCLAVILATVGIAAESYPSRSWGCRRGYPGICILADTRCFADQIGTCNWVDRLGGFQIGECSSQIFQDIGQWLSRTVLQIRVVLVLLDLYQCVIHLEMRRCPARFLIRIPALRQKEIPHLPGTSEVGRQSSLSALVGVQLAFLGEEGLRHCRTYRHVYRG